MKHIHKCERCGTYTMKEKCSCGSKTFIAKPPKFSIEDRYGDYRRKVKFPNLFKNEQMEN